MSEAALDLHDDELVLHGRITVASNATFLASIGDVLVVYKPSAGERPLWDFPEGRLAQREVAAYAVSEALGWRIVPETWLRDGPHGPGMVQRWVEVEGEQEAVTIVSEGEIPAGFRHVFDGLGADDRPVSLVHEDSGALRRMAVFDVLVNNADRKGSHVLEMADGHRYGIDHGICFHTDPKLRTVLWGWSGDALTAEERGALVRISEQLDGSLGESLAAYLSAEEIVALRHRSTTLLAAGELPFPSGDWPPIPWPPL